MKCSSAFLFVALGFKDPFDSLKGVLNAKGFSENADMKFSNGQLCLFGKIRNEIRGARLLGLLFWCDHFSRPVLV
jgi:hypothetical protein